MSDQDSGSGCGCLLVLFALVGTGFVIFHFAAKYW